MKEKIYFNRIFLEATVTLSFDGQEEIVFDSPQVEQPYVMFDEVIVGETKKTNCEAEPIRVAGGVHIPEFTFVIPRDIALQVSKLREKGFTTADMKISVPHKQYDDIINGAVIMELCELPSGLVQLHYKGKFISSKKKMKAI